MKKLLVSIAVALLLVIIITGIGLAALPRGEAGGSFLSTSTTIHSVMDDKFNEVADLSSTVTYAGTLEGTSVLQGTLTVHRDGSGDFRGIETFSGSVNGMPGTLTFEVIGDCDLYQGVRITNTITKGTGELASLYGAISKTGITKDNGPEGTYTVQIDQN